MNEQIEADFLFLSEKYFCSERQLFCLLKKITFEFYMHKKIVISIDVEKQLIYELKNEKIVPFRAKDSEQRAIKKQLIKTLEERKKKIFTQRNLSRIKDFYKKFLGEINRCSIKKIEGENVFLIIKSNKKVLESLVFLIKVDDFLDNDLISVGYNFLFFLKNIEIKEKKIFVKMTRKKPEIIKKEVEKIFDFVEKKYGKRIEFLIDLIDFKNKKIVLIIINKEVEPILKSIKKIVKNRLNFDLFWKIKRGKI